MQEHCGGGRGGIHRRGWIVSLAEAASAGLVWERRARTHALPGTGTRPITPSRPLMGMREDTHQETYHPRQVFSMHTRAHARMGTPPAPPAAKPFHFMGTPAIRQGWSNR